MDHCHKCPTYKATAGRGSLKCLRCQVYRDFVKAHGLRQSVVVKSAPAAILENIEDLSAGMPDVIETLRQMPAELSMVLLGKYVIGLTHAEIGRCFGWSKTHQQRRIKRAELIFRQRFEV